MRPPLMPRELKNLKEQHPSPVQAQVIEALAQWHTITAAAEDADVHRTTIHHWIRSEPAFKTAMQAAHSEYTATLNDGMRELAALALKTLRDLLNDPFTPPALRLKAALAVLQRPHAPNTGWHLPDTIESEPAETNHRATPIAAATEPVAPRTQPKEPAPIARCAPCPCGSGRKYKRCCGAEAVGLPVTPDANPRAA